VDEQRLILVVEDDETTRAFLAENLAADGFRVAGAASAPEALRAIEARQPALVLLDLRLDGGSGLDVLDRVRAADGLASRVDPNPRRDRPHRAVGRGGQGAELRPRSGRPPGQADVSFSAARSPGACTGLADLVERAPLQVRVVRAARRYGDVRPQRRWSRPGTRPARAADS
jgi:hypothetical protein